MNFFKKTKSSQQLGNMEFGRRVAIEKDIERNEANFYNNLSKQILFKITVFKSLNKRLFRLRLWRKWHIFDLWYFVGN